MYADSHAHLCDDRLYDDLPSVLDEASKQGLELIVNICTDEKTLERGKQVSKKYPFVVNAAATTPHDVETDGESFFPYVEKAAQEKSLVAIGETGLDYFYEHSAKSLQKEYLKRYFQLAKKSQLPVIIHCRDAFKDLFDIMDQVYTKEDSSYFPGVLHCYTGGLDEAQELVKRGWTISFSGIVTFKKSEILRQVAASLPLSHLVVETDAPYLAPQKYRGQRNEPAWVCETVSLIAQLRGVNPEVIAQAALENTCRLFNLSIPSLKAKGEFHDN